jgi:hypothetical protein
MKYSTMFLDLSFVHFLIQNDGKKRLAKSTWDILMCIAEAINTRNKIDELRAGNIGAIR